MHYTATFRTHPLLQAAGVQQFFLDDDEPPAAGSRPDRLSAVSGPQERVQRRSVALIEVTVPSVPILDVAVPQMVDVMVEVFTCFDKPSSVEQVIAVPTIDFHHRVPLRTVPRVTQMVEQLVNVPVPQTTPLGAGYLCHWCCVVPATERGVFWWLPGAQHTSWHLPPGWKASPGR